MHGTTVSGTYDPAGSSVSNIVGSDAYCPTDGQVYRVVSQDWLRVELELVATDATGLDDDAFQSLPIVTLDG